MPKLLKGYEGQRRGGGADLVRAKIDMAGMVAVPLRHLRGYTFNAISGGTTSPPSTSNAGNVFGGIGTKVPGGGNGNLPASTKYDGFLFTMRFTGRRVGLIITAGGFTAPFVDSTIDGVLVAETDLATRTELGVVSPAVDVGLAYPLADDLADDGPHILQTLIYPQPGSTSVVYLLGVLLEERMGYTNASEQLDMPTAATTALTTAYANVNPNTLGAVDRLHYSNTNSAPNKVTLALADNTLWGTYDIPAAPGAGQAAYLDIPIGSRPVGNGGLKHKLSTASTDGAVYGFPISAGG